MTVRNLQFKPYPLGAHCEENRIRFSFISKEEDCGIVLYERTTGKLLQKIPFDAGERVGNVYCKYVDGFDKNKITYRFYEKDVEIPDEHARMFVGRHLFGKARKAEDLLAGFAKSSFDWEGDRRPRIPYNECIVYCMHVRGFTRHSSSKVIQRGTFRGIMEKLPYLIETGITTVELQPAYEFLEVEEVKEIRDKMPYPVPEKDIENTGSTGNLGNSRNSQNSRINYWGYKKGYYYAPKAAYAAGEDATIEFKEMVKSFHQNGMEVVMQFYFPREVSWSEIPAILRFWVLEYHVDGFHLMGENLPVEFIAQDAVLADTKLWYYSFDTDKIYGDKQPEYCNLASYNDGYYYAMRKFLKGDENMLETALYHMRHVPAKSGRIHFLSNYYGMTLMDMVSYDRKHNEPNGESNRDGNDYNCSWNCGEEGVTRRKRVTELRRQQLKNALLLLMFSQSTPLIFMGDEFGNSQKGNNNPYCQDNITSWLDWNDLKKHAWIYDFWKMLVQLRKSHPMLHPEREHRIMDYIACGYPDLSYHGQNAWTPQIYGYIRHIGMMFCGKYAKVEQKEEPSIYLAINMHWEPHVLALPKLAKGMKWELLYVSGGLQEAIYISRMLPEDNQTVADELRRRIGGRSIAVYISVEDELWKNRNKDNVSKKRSGKG